METFIFFDFELKSRLAPAVILNHTDLIKLLRSHDMSSGQKTTWTEALDAKLLELWEGNYTIKAIATKMGLTETSVQTRASRRGFGRRKMHEVVGVMADGRTYWSEAEIDKLMTMRISGATTIQMSKHFGRTTSSIHAQISKVDREGLRAVNSVKMRPCRRCGTSFGSSGAGNRHCDPCREVLNDLDW